MTGPLKNILVFQRFCKLVEQRAFVPNTVVWPCRPGKTIRGIFRWPLATIPPVPLPKQIGYKTNVQAKIIGI